jgi:hypothetical protein
LELTNLESAPADDRLLVLADPLPPRTRGYLVKIVDYNQFIDWHQQLLTPEELQYRMRYAFTRRGAAADTITTYSSWAEYASTAQPLAER